MKKHILFTVFISVFFLLKGWSQIIVSENIGTTSSTTTIAGHAFQNGGLTFSNGAQTNPADVRNTSVSSGYSGSSGGANIFFSSTSGAYGFSIEGINSSNYNTLSLQFGYRKEAAASLASLSVDYWNGSSWNTIANTSSALFNEASGATAGWYLSKVLSLPTGAQNSNLKIRFVKTGTVALRIDDVKLTGIETFPSVVNNFASGITTDAAVFSGNVTATGGSSIIANGTVYSETATNANPAIGGSGVTTLATAAPGAGTGTFSNSSATLLPNVEYSYNAYATKSTGLTGYGTVDTFYTLAVTPSAPIISSPTGTTLNIAIGNDNNSTFTKYAIYETTTYKYLQPNGTLGTSAVYKTKSLWGTKTITGLTPNTTYTFKTIAVNRGEVFTALSPSSNGTTLELAAIVTDGTLTALTTVYGTSSSVLSFSFSGSNLTDDVILTAPTGFEISKTAGGLSGYAATQTVSASVGTINSTTIFVRLAATTGYGDYAGNISLSSANDGITVNVPTQLSSVTKLTVSVSGITIANKACDGNTSATILGTATVPGILAIDSTTVSLTTSGVTANFVNPLVGIAKPVTVAGYTLTGSAASNYLLLQPGGLLAAITANASSDIIYSVGTRVNSNTNLNYAAYQGTTLTTTASGINGSIGVFGFYLRDGGAGLNDPDDLDTDLKAITFNVTNAANIRSARLFIGNSPRGVPVTVTGTSSLVFPELTNIVAGDNSQLAVNLRVTFKSTVTDNQQMQFTITSATAKIAGSEFATANGGGATSSVSGDINRIEVIADRLAFIKQPTDSFVNADMNPAPTVEAIDENSNRDLDYSDSISITSTGTMAAPVTVNAVNGFAFSTTINHISPGTSLKLTAINAALHSANSGLFTISPLITPVFNPVTAICSGDSAPALPTTSLNGIIGSWSPVVSNIATATYTFTPAPGQNAVSTSLTITVNEPVSPTFNQIEAVLSGSTITLPPSSLEAINGTWSPAIDNTVTTTYTFTPNSGQCATNASMTVVIMPNPPSISTTDSPGGKLENVFDRFGNKYTLDEISTGPHPNVNNKSQMLSSSLLCNSGIFELYFEAGSGMEGSSASEVALRAVVCQVFSDLSDFIKSPLHNSGNSAKIKIWVRDITQVNNASYFLGLATGFYNIPSSPNVISGGILDNEIWKTIHSGTDSYTNVTSPIFSNGSNNGTGASFYHGMMAINPNINWNTDLSVNASTSQTDLYSVVLHEVTHALGFASLINYDGNSKLGTSYNYYSRYDTFLKANNLNLVQPSNSSCSMLDNYFNADPALLTPGCGLVPPDNTGTPVDHTNCGSEIFYEGTNIVPVYTSSCFEAGSSLGHFEDECFVDPSTSLPYGNNNYFVMSNANSPGATKRYLKPEEKATLCDLGYNMQNTYGNSSQNSYYDYGTTTCTGIEVAGTNDGISGTSYSFMTTINQPITFTGILDNDVSYNTDYSLNNQNNLRFECLEDVYDANAIISSSGNDLNATISFSSAIGGVHLLRYVPFDAVTGHRGNITYVYVFVRAVINSCGTPNTCNLVMNGDFEQNSATPYVQGDFPYVCGWKAGYSGNTPDYMYRNNNFSWVNIPCNFIGSQESTTPITNNKGYAGLFIIGTGNSVASESIVNQLSTPLLANTRYQLQLDLSLAEESTAEKKVQVYFGYNEDLQIAFGGVIPSILPGDPMLFETEFITDQNDWTHVNFDFTTGSTAGQNFMYIGGLSDVKSQVIVPTAFTPCVGTFNYNFMPDMSYYYIDNVSVVPLHEADFILPETVCSTVSLSDLSNYLVSTPPTGVFTGDGVVASGTSPNIVYSFDPSSLSVGSHIISYAYVPSLGCPPITISDTIEVTLCPEFDPIAPLCQGTVAPSLPANPINIPTLVGTWNPLTIDTSVAGTFTYTFTPATGQGTTTTGTVSVTFLPAPNAGSLTGPTIVAEAGTINLTPSVLGGSWSSGDVAICTVDSNGVVTGVSAGTTSITYTVTGSNTCTASTTVYITVMSVDSSCTSATVWDGTSWNNGTPNTQAFLNTAVVFAAPFTFNEDLYACSVLVSNSATVTVAHIGVPTTNTAYTLTVANEVISSGGMLNFEDDSSLVQINDATNIGNITYKRTTPEINKFDYTYWSTPVDNQSLFDLSPYTGGDKFYRFDPLINNWSNTPNNTIMDTGTGYIIRGPQGYDPGVYTYDGYFIGVPHNGTYTTPVYNSASTMNLIGNPYPSGLNIDCFLADPSNSHLGGAVYLWSHNIPIDWTGTTQQGFPGSAVYNYNVNSYVAYNRLGGVGSGITSIENDVFSTDRSEGTIAAGQSFFIESNATGVATFKNDMRVGSQNQENSQFYKAGASMFMNSPCATEERHRLWLQIRNMTPAQQFKQTLIGYAPSATTSPSLDRGYDAKTYVAQPYSINLYSLSPGSDQLTIQGRHLSDPFDDTDEILLGYTCKLNPLATSNTIQIAASEFDGLFTTTTFYLRITQGDGSFVYHDLKASPYQFSITASVIDDITTFAIVFVVPPGGVIVKNPIPLDFEAMVFPNPFEKSFSISLQSPIKEAVNITVYDLLGKQLINETMSFETFKKTIFEKAFSSGVYQAVITQGPYKQTLKIIKK